MTDPFLEKIVRYFADRTCKQCNQAFNERSLTIVNRSESGFAVRIVCQRCDCPLGTALIAFNDTCGRPVDSRVKDTPKKPQPPPITADDVLNASRLIHSFGDDWAKYLPKRKGRKTNDK